MDSKYRYGTDENKEFMQVMRQDLLRFGRRFPSPGGGAWYLGDDGTPWADRPRETWITCRMAHVYSIGTMLQEVTIADNAGNDWNAPDSRDTLGSHALAAPAYAALVDAALSGLQGELRDCVNGGWFSGIRADGTPLPDKLCYQHAFVILAASSAYLAGRPGGKALLDEALALYDRYYWNEEEGLSADTWNMDFTVLSPYRGLNSNMHTTEAFLAVADALHDERYRERAGRIIEWVIGWASESDWRIPEHFDSSWTPDPECNHDHPDDPFKPYGATPGHSIEWARLILQWALSARKDAGGAAAARAGAADAAAGAGKARASGSATPGSATPGSAASGSAAIPDSAAPYIEAAENLFLRAVTDAWNADGSPGLVYTTDWDGHPVVHDRMHWTLAEAINTSAVLYRITGKEAYADWYAVFMEYLDRCVLDHVNGSWFHQLDSGNRLKGTVWPGKSDLYHAFQATLIPYLDPAVSIAAAVRAQNGC